MPVITKNSQSGTLGKNLMLITFLLVLVGIGGTYQFLLPGLTEARKENAEKNAKLTGLQDDLKKLQDVQQQLSEGEKSLADRGVDIKQLRQIFPSYENMPQMYIQIENLQKKTEFVQSNFQVGTPIADPAGGARIPVNFSAMGSLDELKNFLNDVKQNIRPILVSNISFNQGVTVQSPSNTSAPAATSQANASQYNLNGNGYVLVGNISDSYIAN